MAAASDISEGKSVNLDHLKTKPAKSTLDQHQKFVSFHFPILQ